MIARRRWSRDELLAVLHLYSRLPFGQFDRRNSEVIRLAKLLGRSPGAVALKLANYAHLDPYLDRGGMANVSAADRSLWDEYLADPEIIVLEAEAAVRNLGLGSEEGETPEETTLREGEERDALTRVRVNQRFFRRLVLARYESACVVTGLDIPELLVAAHIVPWAEAPELRLNPRNGLCLNPLHDRAFESGAIVVDDSFRIRVAPRISALESEPTRQLLTKYEGRLLILRGDVKPDIEFLRRHRERFAP